MQTQERIAPYPPLNEESMPIFMEASLQSLSRMLKGAADREVMLNNMKKEFSLFKKYGEWLSERKDALLADGEKQAASRLPFKFKERIEIADQSVEMMENGLRKVKSLAPYPDMYLLAAELSIHVGMVSEMRNYADPF